MRKLLLAVGCFGLSLASQAVFAQVDPHFFIQVNNRTPTKLHVTYEGSADFRIPGLDNVDILPGVSPGAGQFYSAYLPEPPHPGSLNITFANGSKKCIFKSDQPAHGQPTMEFVPRDCGEGHFGGSFTHPEIYVTILSVT